MREVSRSRYINTWSFPSIVTAGLHNTSIILEHLSKSSKPHGFVLLSTHLLASPLDIPLPFFESLPFESEDRAQWCKALCLLRLQDTASGYGKTGVSTPAVLACADALVGVQIWDAALCFLLNCLGELEGNGQASREFCRSLSVAFVSCCFGFVLLFVPHGGL